MSYTAIRPRRGTAAQWVAANPVLIEGEIGFEVPDDGVGTGVIKMKQGDGVTKWLNLPYAIFDVLNEYTLNNPTIIGYLSMNRAANTDIGINSITLGYRCTASGDYSIASGYMCKANGDYSTISGGFQNTASGDYSTVSGGLNNTAKVYCSTVSGGINNTASGDYSTVSCGYNNKASGDYSTVSGGAYNEASGDYSTISGGFQNTASGDYSTVSCGYNNKASGNYSTISGGFQNTASGDYSTVSGGAYNEASGDYSTVSGGINNEAEYDYQTVIGLYNDNQSDSLFEIGNGTIDSRSNAFRVTNNGDAYLKRTYYGGSIVLDGVISNDRVSGSQVGNHSTAIGQKNIASGSWSVAEGNVTIAEGVCSHTAGRNTIAGYENQFVIGLSNNNKSDSLFEIGNGNNNKLSEFVLKNEKTFGQGDLKAVVKTYQGILGIYNDGICYYYSDESIQKGTTDAKLVSGLQRSYSYNYLLISDGSATLCVETPISGVGSNIYYFNSLTPPSSLDTPVTLENKRITGICNDAAHGSRYYVIGETSDGDSFLLSNLYGSDNWEEVGSASSIVNMNPIIETIGNYIIISSTVGKSVFCKLNTANIWDQFNPPGDSSTKMNCMISVNSSKCIIAGDNSESYYVQLVNGVLSSEWTSINGITNGNIIRLQSAGDFVLAEVKEDNIYNFYYCNLVNSTIEWKKLSDNFGANKLCFCGYDNSYDNYSPEFLVFVHLLNNSIFKAFSTSIRSNAFRVTKTGDIYCSGKFYGNGKTDPTSMEKVVVSDSLKVQGDTELQSISCTTGTFSGGISANGSIISRNSNGLIVGALSAPHALIRSDNTNIYFLVCDANSDTFNTLRPLSYNSTTGRVTISHGIDLKGNYSIGSDISISNMYQSNVNPMSPSYSEAWHIKTYQASNEDMGGLPNYGSNLVGLEIYSAYTLKLNCPHLTVSSCVSSLSTAASNCYIDSTGTITKTSGSSKRFKYDIKPLENKELDPIGLYDVDIVQYKLKDEYISKDDIRYKKDMIGFIAEDMYEKFKPGADYHIDEDGKEIPDDWNLRMVVPAMLKLIQDLKKEVDELKNK